MRLFYLVKTYSFLIKRYKFTIIVLILLIKELIYNSNIIVDKINLNFSRVNDIIHYNSPINN